MHCSICAGLKYDDGFWRQYGVHAYYVHNKNFWQTILVNKSTT